ncbi:alpha/beta fold hydrolase [Pseudodesulfovibrio sediminis]|uniref:AB hydrolase superfamily protein YdjP n=1 Tax=Pseudodesulfovibrio sediminis TaxID=2810563 RepID=A0ABM7P2N2_9BACT|nr:alpha/beta hydrolase [Pseudodesulfovibrio sediminis]BCS87019.1 AB hydrolase superfamily protein YdjP [Pseudodesulfovibrio sediminis]
MDLFEAVETIDENQVAGWVQTTDGVRLWVDIRGMGRPIVFIHGWTMSSLFWRRQHLLAEKYQIITIDLRGHGRSQTTPRGHTIPRYATDVREVICALRLTDIMLLGWSMGGSIVLEYWSKYGANKLAAIGLVESAPYPMSPAQWNPHTCRGHDTAAMHADFKAIADDREGFADRFINAMHLSDDAPSHAGKWMKSEQLRVPASIATDIYEDYVQRDYTSVLPTITVPALVMYGRSRHMCYGPSTGRYIAGSIPESRFVILDKSGHLPFYEQAETFNAALSQFIDQLDS